MLLILSRITLLIQAVLSIVFVGLIYKINVLPFKYVGALALILVLFWVFVFFLQRRPSKQYLQKNAYYRSQKSRLGGRRKKRSMLVREKISMILTILSCIVLVLGNYYIYLGESTLDEITDTTQTTVHTINVRVMSDSGYDTLASLVDQDVQFCTINNVEYVSKYINKLQDENNLTTSIASDYGLMIANLYTGNAAAIVIDTMDEIYLAGLHEDYQNETIVIASYEIEVANDDSDTTTKVNTSTEVPDVMNVFVSGIDTYGSIATVARSDVNMILTINFNTNEILMTGIPRDYYVTLHTYQASDKLTHAGNYGVEESVATVEDLMGIDIDYYIRVNFTSVIDIVDALEGIDFYNPKAFTAVNKYYMPVGEVELDGEQALFYARERHTLPGGDNDRIANQQRIISAIIDKAISPSIITNYPSLLEASLAAMQTNMSTGLITNIIKEQLDEGFSWNLQHQYLEGTPSRSTECYSAMGYDLYVTLPDEDSIAAANENIEKVSNGISVTFDNESSYVNSSDIVE